jgi:hypothetical protein
LLTNNKEVIETPTSVQFLFAHKELFRQELQLPMSKYNAYIVEHMYGDFGEKRIKRIQIMPYILGKNYSSSDRNIQEALDYIQKAQERLAEEGKYIATGENAFNAIL